MSSRPVEQAAPRLRVDLERDRAAVEATRSCCSRSIRASPGLHQRLHLVLGSATGSRPIFVQLRVEDVGEAGRDDRLEAVVLERPRRVLARRAAAEVAARRPGSGSARQLPAGLLAPVVEEELAEAGALDPLQELLGDDLVGVDVGAVEQRDAGPR